MPGLDTPDGGSCLIKIFRRRQRPPDRGKQCLAVPRQGKSSLGTRKQGEPEFCFNISQHMACRRLRVTVFLGGTRQVIFFCNG